MRAKVLGVSGVTFDEFTFDRWHVHLRRAKKGDTVYHWTRSIRRYPFDGDEWWEMSPHLLIGGISVGAGTGFTSPPGTTQWTKAVGLRNVSWSGMFSMYDPMSGGRFLQRKSFTTNPM